MYIILYIYTANGIVRIPAEFARVKTDRYIIIIMIMCSAYVRARALYNSLTRRQLETLHLYL